MSNKTVMVAMSGGVDSSVALIKIIESGYKAIGVTMKLWDYANALKAGRAENQKSTIRIVRTKIVSRKLRKPLKPKSIDTKMPRNGRFPETR